MRAPILFAAGLIMCLFGFILMCTDHMVYGDLTPVVAFVFVYLGAILEGALIWGINGKHQRAEISTLKRTYNQLFDVTRREQKRAEQAETKLLEEIGNRDRWEERATNLAILVGDHFCLDVGEHSSQNCPIAEADGLLMDHVCAPAESAQKCLVTAENQAKIMAEQALASTKEKSKIDDYCQYPGKDCCKSSLGCNACEIVRNYRDDAEFNGQGNGKEDQR